MAKKNYLLRLNSSLAGERERFFLWMPVLLGLGIEIYFSLKDEPTLLFSGILLLFVFFIFVLSNAGINKFLFRLRLFAAALFLIALGFFAANFRAVMVKSPVLAQATETVTIKGRVEELEHLAAGYRMIITNSKIDGIGDKETPYRLRITVRTEIGDIVPGDWVRFRGRLGAPPPPVYPGGYDFARYAYFTKIGAVGFSLTPIRKITGIRMNGIERWKYDITGIIDNLRFTIADRIYQAMAAEKEQGKVSQEAAVTAAMLVGQQNGLDKKTANDLRASGLYHLISISGLHMVIVMGVAFFSFRAILALYPYFALTGNIKKWAAMFTLILGFGYLLLAGAPVPAVRSYIMAGLFFLAILLDRSNSMMRPVALAAFLILLFVPESLLGASFQLSFAAVIALIAFFNAGWEKLARHDNVIIRGFFYFLSLAFSSLIASSATAPFIIYDFGQFNGYGILANLLAVPITSFVIMPFGMMSLLLLPLHLEKFTLWPVKYAVDAILKIGETVANLPYATAAIHPMPAWGIAFITFGGLILCLMRSRLRLSGIVLIAIGFSSLIFFAKPDIIIDGRGKLFALKGEDGNLYFSSLVPAKYARGVWLAKNGQEFAENFKKFPETKDVNLECDGAKCIYLSRGRKITVMNGEVNSADAGGDSYCKNSSLLVSLAKGGIPGACLSDAKLVITSADLENNGTYAVWLKGLEVQTVRQETGNRLWQTHYTEDGDF